jgi:hypothetical protein
MDVDGPQPPVMAGAGGWRGIARWAGRLRWWRVAGSGGCGGVTSRPPTLQAVALRHRWRQLLLPKQRRGSEGWAGVSHLPLPRFLANKLDRCKQAHLVLVLLVLLVLVLVLVLLLLLLLLFPRLFLLPLLLAPCLLAGDSVAATILSPPCTQAQAQVRCHFLQLSRLPHTYGGAATTDAAVLIPRGCLCCCVGPHTVR